MMTRYGVSLLAAVLLGGIASPVDAGETIGRIKVAKGEAFRIRGDDRIPATVGVPIELNDQIETGDDGSVGITFLDETRISVGPRSEVTVDEYLYAPKELELSFAARLARGTLFYTSGVIAHLAPENTKITTPEGTIGIRGTRFVVKVDG